MPTATPTLPELENQLKELQSTAYRLVEQKDQLNQTLAVYVNKISEVRKQVKEEKNKPQMGQSPIEPAPAQPSPYQNADGE